MALGGLFKSKKEQEFAERRQRRKAFRDAQTAIDAVQDRMASLKADRDANWNEARTQLGAGRKEAAQRSLRTVRANELLIGQLDKKRWMFQQSVTRLEMARSDKEFAESLGTISAIMSIEPESIREVMEDVQDTLGDQKDIEKMWNQLYDKEMGDAARATDAVPSLEEMMKALEDEAVNELRIETSTAAAHDGGSIAEEISKGRKRLRDLLDDSR